MGKARAKASRKLKAHGENFQHAEAKPKIARKAGSSLIILPLQKSFNQL
jgi:hypothetical protein